MIILSHRGFWLSPEEKNTAVSLERSLKNGFGLETDIRDFKGNLVISHDIAGEKSLHLDTFFSSYADSSNKVTLALNIKADGLQSLLRKSLDHYGIENYFVFDMSIPEGIVYQRNGFHFFTRQSDYEPEPCLYKSAMGVWLDAFDQDRIDKTQISKHLENGKQVCVVSPELHGRPFLPFWSELSETGLTTRPELILCTDFPHKAREFFNEAH